MSDETDGKAVAIVEAPMPSVPLALRLIGETAAMVRFYSRLPLPALGRFDDPANPPPFAIACRMLPLASFVIAFPAALILFLLGMTALPPLFIAIVAIAVALMTTGALHEDGLADTADGFGGGRDATQKLAIMKDSRIGSYGAAALMLALMARVVLLGTLLGKSPVAAAMILVAAAILSRTLSLGLFAVLPAARTDGVASTVGGPEPSAMALAGGIALVLTLAIVTPMIGLGPACLGVVVASVVAIALGRLARAQIGGQTGDVLGAAQVLAEIGFLAGALAITGS